MSVSGPGATAKFRALALDEQQQVLLEAVHRARGAPVSYRRLRELGIEYPASVVSELELAGLPLRHRFDDTAADGSPGVRLHMPPNREEGAGGTARAHLLSLARPRPAWAIERIDLSRAAIALRDHGRDALVSLAGLAAAALSAVKDATRALAATADARPAQPRRRAWVRGRLPRVARTGTWSSGRSRAASAWHGTQPTHWLAPGALIAAGAAVAVLAASDLGRPGRARPATAHRRSAELRSGLGKTASTERPASPTLAAPGTASRTAPAPPQPPATSATPVSPALAAELEARGHQMLEAGRPADAIQALRLALAATGESLSSCLEPTSETCLTYAYALYDLGRALQLDGQPDAAVLILERRLRIANQRRTVEGALQLARMQASRQTPSSIASH